MSVTVWLSFRISEWSILLSIIADLSTSDLDLIVMVPSLLIRMACDFYASIGIENPSPDGSSLVCQSPKPDDGDLEFCYIMFVPSCEASALTGMIFSYVVVSSRSVCDRGTRCVWLRFLVTFPYVSWQESSSLRNTSFLPVSAEPKLNFSYSFCKFRFLPTDGDCWLFFYPVSIDLFCFRIFPHTLAFY